MSHRRFASMLLVASGLFGQAASADAPPGRYTVSSGTVTDTRTGLTWQQATAPGTYTQANAKTYCTGLSLNGTGWRLPTGKELFSIVDLSQASSPTIDVTYFPSTQSSYYWASTPAAGSSGIGWYVHFGDGHTYVADVTVPYDVRCVR